MPSARPQASVDLASQSRVAAADAWYRRPVVVAVGTALAVLAVGAGIMITSAAHVWQHADTQRQHHSRAHEPESRFIQYRYADQQPTVIDRIGYRNALVDY